MSDISTNGGAPAAPAPAAAPAAAPEAAPAAAPTQPTAGAPASAAPASAEFDAWSDPVRAREYAVKLREEAAKYRQTYQPFERAFGGLSQENQRVMLALGEALADPARHGEVAEFMLGSARQLAGDGFGDLYGRFAPEPPAPAAEAPAIPSNPEDLAKFIQEQTNQVLTEREQQAQAEAAAKAEQDQLVAQVQRDLEQLGYQPVATDPTDPAQIAKVQEADMVCTLAIEHCGNDLQRAHEMFQELKAQWGRETLAKLPQSTPAPASAGNPAPTAAGGKTPVSGRARVAASKAAGLYGGN